MPNISETGGETFTKFAGFFGSSLGYPVQNMEGICPPNFVGRGGNLWPHISKMRGPGLKILCTVGK